jgi:hypothetical protein
LRGLRGAVLVATLGFVAAGSATVVAGATASTLISGAGSVAGSCTGCTDTLPVGNGHGAAGASDFFANNFLSNDNIQFSLVKYLTLISSKL